MSTSCSGVFCANISLQILGASPHLHHSSKTCRVLRLQCLPRRHPGESLLPSQYSHSVPTLWGLVGSRLRLGSSSLFCERHPRGCWDPHPGWTIHSAWPPEIRTYANTTGDKEYPQKNQQSILVGHKNQMNNSRHFNYHSQPTPPQRTSQQHFTPSLKQKTIIWHRLNPTCRISDCYPSAGGVRRCLALVMSFGNICGLTRDRQLALGLPILPGHHYWPSPIPIIIPIIIVIIIDNCCPNHQTSKDKCLQRVQEITKWVTIHQTVSIWINFALTVILFCWNKERTP